MKRVMCIGSVLAVALAACAASQPQVATVTAPSAPYAGARSTNGTCTRSEVNSYMVQVEAAITELDRLSRAFGDTQTPNEAENILAETEALFDNIIQWQVPKCAEEVQINLLLAIGNITGAMQAVLNNDLQGFQREYSTYRIAVEQLNAEIQNLMQATPSD